MEHRYHIAMDGDVCQRTSDWWLDWPFVPHSNGGSRLNEKQTLVCPYRPGNVFYIFRNPRIGDTNRDNEARMYRSLGPVTSSWSVCPTVGARPNECMFSSRTPRDPGWRTSHGAQQPAAGKIGWHDSLAGFSLLQKKYVWCALDSRRMTAQVTSEANRVYVENW